jgi:hypothetical protein
MVEKKKEVQMDAGGWREKRRLLFVQVVEGGNGWPQ